MPRYPRYLHPHPKGGWRYQRHIPLSLRLLVGKREMIVRYLPQMLARDAEKSARKWVDQDDALFARLRNLSPENAEELALVGGIDPLKQEIALLDEAHVSLERLAAHIDGDVLTDLAALAALQPRDVGGVDTSDLAGALASLDVGDLALALIAAKTYAKQQLAPTIEKSRTLVLKVAPMSVEHSLDGLFDLWVKVREPKITRHHKHSIVLLKEFFGDIDYRTIKQADIRSFTDDLAKRGLTKVVQISHLTRVRTLFAAAANRAIIDTNPAAGIKVDGKPPKSKRTSFTGPQLALILDKAVATRFGGKRHTEALWLLRLVIYTGARINELAQLRKDDVCVEAGVPLIHIREGEGQSVKTGESRKVPLHPLVAGFIEYAAASKTDFIFDAFPCDPVSKRGGWLITNFPRFRRDVCGINDGDVKLHSIRHRFVDACRNASIPEERAKALVGHAAGDVHGRYGQGAGLKVLAADMAKVDPLAE